MLSVYLDIIKVLALRYHQGTVSRSNDGTNKDNGLRDDYNEADYYCGDSIVCDLVEDGWAWMLSIYKEPIVLLLKANKDVGT